MPPIEVIEPEAPSRLIASIPHSGTRIPEHAAPYFTSEHCAALLNTDWYVDRLYDFLPALGVTIVKANIFRYVVDVNREAVAPLYGNFWKCVVPSAIPSGTPHSWELYRKEPERDEIMKRVTLYYEPYHEALTHAIGQLRDQYGLVILFDLHSYIGGSSVDISLGNSRGTTCSDGLMDAVSEPLAAQFSVAYNSVYTGGYTVRRYHQADVQTLQIEVRSGAFIDPGELDRGRPPRLSKERMKPLQARLQEAFTGVLTRFA